MSTAYATIPKQGLEIVKAMPGVEPGYYESMADLLDDLSKQNAAEDSAYKRARFVVSNYVYLIYERLQRNMVREIDYDRVKSWASINKKLAGYLLKQQWDDFPMEVFEKWIAPDIDLLSCGIYSRSNRFTKNIYH